MVDGTLCSFCSWDPIKFVDQVVAISGNEDCLDQDGNVLSNVRLSTGSDAVLAEPVTS